MESVASRVAAAIAYLRRAGQPVSRQSIVDASRRLHGRPLAKSSIFRCPDAEALYRAARTWQPPRRKRGRLPPLGGVDAADKDFVAALRRRSKDQLIRLLLQKDAVLRHQKSLIAVLSGSPLDSVVSTPAVDALAEINKLMALQAMAAAHHRRYHPGPPLGSAR